MIPKSPRAPSLTCDKQRGSVDFFQSKATKFLKTRGGVPESDKTIPISDIRGQRGRARANGRFEALHKKGLSVAY